MITHVDHISIQTNDFDYAFKFYHHILGFQIVKQPFSFKTRRLCYLNAGNINIELYSTKSNDKPAIEYVENRGGLDHIAFIVENIDNTVEQLRKKGIKIIKAPFYPPTDDRNQPRIAFIEGPDKQEIEIRESTGSNNTAEADF
ncbi:VOC family protein [Candidatus Dojkabacteria bacterium]|nr:VOC family protein [Candidatus Dojkabacteria bacterium]